MNCHPPPPAGGPNLLELLEESAAGRGVVRFVPDHPDTLSFADLWRDSERAARWLSSHVSEGGCVAAVLDSSPACLAALVGAWRAGLTLASLPSAARGASAAEYHAQIERICNEVHAELLMVEDSASLPPTIAIRQISFQTCLARARGGRTNAVGNFVQFTSGSTLCAKGVRLSLTAIASNILAILEALGPAAGDNVCSWLPLSHDMGLIGLCLTPWVAASPAIAGAGTLCLIRPRAFLNAPSLWLTTCSEIGATITAAPSFAFGLAAKAMSRGAPQLNLRPLRVCITGAETVDASALREFADTASGAGFKDRAFCPAYGMAEATLAVTMVRPAESWRSYTVDPVALASGHWVENSAGRELVSTGAPLTGMDVRIHSGSDIGAVEIAGPSLLSGYVGREGAETTGDWFPTSDLGVMVDGQLIITGRQDDLLIVGGRNLYAGDIECIVNKQRGVRAANSVALTDYGDDRYVVVAEAYPRANLTEVCHQIRAALIERIGAGPSSITLISPGSMPRTPSGKLARHRVAAKRASGDLSMMTHLDFRPKRSTPLNQAVQDSLREER